MSEEGRIVGRIVVDVYGVTRARGMGGPKGPVFEPYPDERGPWEEYWFEDDYDLLLITGEGLVV